MVINTRSDLVKIINTPVNQISIPAQRRREIVSGAKKLFEMGKITKEERRFAIKFADEFAQRRGRETQKVFVENVVSSIESRTQPQLQQLQQTSVEQARQQAREGLKPITEEELRQTRTQVSEFTGGRGEIRAATKEQIKAAEKSRNPFAQLVSGFREGGLISPIVTGEPTPITSIQGTFAQDPRSFRERLPETARELGRLGGTVFDIATFGILPEILPSAKGAVQAAKSTRLGSAAIKAEQAARTLPFGNLLVGAGEITAAGFAGAKATELGLNIRTGRERDLVEANIKAFREGLKAESEGKTGLSRIGAEIFPQAFGSEEKFVEAVEKNLKQQGLSRSEIVRATEQLRQERRVRLSAEVAGLLTSGATSEAVGKRSVKQVLATKEPTFRNLFLPIAQAGFGEGFGQITLAQQQRGQQRPFFSAREQRNIMGLNLPITRFEESLIGGGLGFVTAGVLGGAIGSASAKGRKLQSGFLEGIGSVLDPLEKPSDILESIISTTPVRSRVPTIIPSITPSQTPAQIQSNINNMIGVPVQVQKPSSIIDSIISFTPTPTPTPTPTTTPIPIPTPVDTPIPIFIETPVESTTPITIPVEVPTPVSTPVNIPVPIFTDFIGAPLPLPLVPSLSGGGGFGAIGRKERKRFDDELSESLDIFGDLTGIRVIQRKRKKETKKTKKKTTRQRSRGFTINDLLFG